MCNNNTSTSPCFINKSHRVRYLEAVKRILPIELLICLLNWCNHIFTSHVAFHVSIYVGYAVHGLKKDETHDDKLKWHVIAFIMVPQKCTV